VALKATGGSAENRPLVRAVMRADATVYVMSLVLVAVAFVLRSLLAVRARMARSFRWSLRSEK